MLGSTARDISGSNPSRSAILLRAERLQDCPDGELANLRRPGVAVALRLIADAAKGESGGSRGKPPLTHVAQPAMQQARINVVTRCHRTHAGADFMRLGDNSEEQRARASASS